MMNGFAASPVPADAPPVRVLVVDDDVHLSKALQRTLRHHGFAVDVVLDGQAAIERVSSESYDVMLLDLCLENMDGLEVYESVASKPSAPTTILHSAHLDIRTAVQATRSGVCEVLEKPVPERVLVDRIRDAARQHRLAAAGEGAPSSVAPDGAKKSLPDLQREYTLHAFEGSGKNLSRAARELGIPRSTLRDRLRRYGVR